MTNTPPPSQNTTLLGWCSRELSWLVALIFQIYVTLVLVTYHPKDQAWSQSGGESQEGTVHNAGGALGALISDVGFSLFGYSLMWWVVAGWVFLVGHYYFRRKNESVPRAIHYRWGSAFLLLLVGSCGLEALYQFRFSDTAPLGAGGLLGVTLRTWGEKLIGIYGITLILMLMCATGWSMITKLSWLNLLEKTGIFCEYAAIKLFHQTKMACIKWQQAKQNGQIVNPVTLAKVKVNASIEDGFLSRLPRFFSGNEPYPFPQTSTPTPQPNTVADHLDTPIASPQQDATPSTISLEKSTWQDKVEDAVALEPIKDRFQALVDKVSVSLKKKPETPHSSPTPLPIDPIQRTEPILGNLPIETSTAPILEKTDTNTSVAELVADHDVIIKSEAAIEIPTAPLETTPMAQAEALTTATLADPTTTDIAATDITTSAPADTTLAATTEEVILPESTAPASPTNDPADTTPASIEMAAAPSSEEQAVEASHPNEPHDTDNSLIKAVAMPVDESISTHIDAPSQQDKAMPTSAEMPEHTLSAIVENADKKAQAGEEDSDKKMSPTDTTPSLETLSENNNIHIAENPSSEVSQASTTTHVPEVHHEQTMSIDNVGSAEQQPQEHSNAAITPDNAITTQTSSEVIPETPVTDDAIENPFEENDENVTAIAASDSTIVTPQAVLDSAEAVATAPAAPQATLAANTEPAAPQATQTLPDIAEAPIKVVKLPPLDLLDTPPPPMAGEAPEKLESMARLIEGKLKEFGVNVNVVAWHPGPVITRFEIEPASGVKGSQIVNLVKDLARALSVISIRVVETIPGRNTMGLEIPNPQRQIVRLRSILDAPIYQQAESRLTLAMGQDIAGLPQVADLAKMPHALVAGTTGSGKSVAINAMILSILFKASPEEVRLIMIDPKMLELSIYEGIPHLLAPVVTDMKLAAHALNWCVGEMDKRYRIMSMVGVRNLAGYNQKIREAQQAGKPIPNPLSLTPEKPEPLEPMATIVVMIDELADLMMVAGKKIEELIARLAQKARAAGIHLILATQRPSVDVITGLIKANVPTRVAFQVSSKIDSRTILDQMGAETLLGQGDMLYLPPGTGFTYRMHGAFVSDQEVHRVVEFWRAQGAPNYVEGILEPEESATAIEAGVEGSEEDPLYDDAVGIVIKNRRASISLVQRQLRIGYNRAARLIEQMEAAGLVSSMQSNGNREVLVPPSSSYDHA